MNLYSNEIVFRGHPDKVCDQISAAILDACLRKDKNTRAGIEVAGGKGMVFITGEITTKAKPRIKGIAKRVLNDVGYEASKYQIINNIGIQSQDIALGVDKGGAGDQGMMFGYACDDTKEMLPTAQVILQKLAEKYDDLRQAFPQYLYPDGKAQITGYYDSEFKLQKIKTFTISYQNSETNREFTDKIVKKLATDILKDYAIGVEEWLINPTGKFNIGGFEGDAGLTGRKIVVDAYQSFANVGGGCMNGKDPSKVDMSAAYMARKLACEYLEEHNLKWCEIQLSYAIGVEEPLAIYVRTNNGEYYISHEEQEKLNERCKPKNLIKELGLTDPTNIRYEEQARYGHFRKAYR